MCLLASLLCLALPAEAATRRSRAGRPAPKPAAVKAQPPAVAPVRNVILFIADGYGEGHWREARAAQPDGLLAVDRMPVTGIALPPAGLTQYSAARLGEVLGAGRGPEDEAYQVPLLSLARQYGRSVGLVSGRAVTDPLPGALVVSVGREDDADVLRRLAAARVDVLFGRGGPDPSGLPATAGYRVAADAPALLTGDAVPAATVVSAATVPFDTLVFRALHLTARGPKGLMMAVAADPGSVAATELNAAITVALNFARRDERALVLVASRRGDTGLDLYAEGQGAPKFAGTIAATDVPKIVAGLAGLKVFRRDFSPLFAERSQPLAPSPAPLTLKAGTNGTRALPW